MHSNLNFLFALLALLVLASLIMATRGCGESKYPPAFSPQMTLETAVKQSAETGRPVLLFFTADWCGPCQSLKRGALSNRRVTRWIEENAIAVYMDATHANASDPEMQVTLSRYGVRAFPTLIMLEPGRELEQRGRHVGPARRRELLEWLERVGQAQ